ncbi:hypothetical protein PROFUN_03111 [Planoprotostelium fungivorum]|uniref:Uncharacterized protein n=1 Tax=Planoprotostelium fungivorum TaxID=1890364 RepID=A0A2P6NQ95_9EUKA|nr:hypothetical protein PROFUN_03111 [Planoprotostelium fungivorum]
MARIRFPLRRTAILQDSYSFIRIRLDSVAVLDTRRSQRQRDVFSYREDCDQAGILSLQPALAKPIFKG